MTMNVATQLAHMTVRIECDEYDGQRSVGTGFFISLCEREDAHVRVIVTNKHVIENAQRGIFYMNVGENGSPRYGAHRQIEIENFEPQWVKHPDPEIDLAALSLAPVLELGRQNGVDLFSIAGSRDFIADPSYMSELDFIEDIIMIGYPNGLWDAENNLPIIRRGITATPPSFDYEGRPEFMIDCACFPGSSGSPIFSLKRGPRIEMKDKEVIATTSSQAKLLGILWAGPQYVAPGVVQAVPVPTSDKQVVLSEIPNNLGYCIKAEQLLAFEDYFAELTAG